jgi:hypothetical protein
VHFATACANFSIGLVREGIFDVETSKLSDVKRGECRQVRGNIDGTCTVRGSASIIIKRALATTAGIRNHFSPAGTYPRAIHEFTYAAEPLLPYRYIIRFIEVFFKAS